MFNSYQLDIATTTSGRFREVHFGFEMILCINCIPSQIKRCRPLPRLRTCLRLIIFEANLRVLAVETSHSTKILMIFGFYSEIFIALDSFDFLTVDTIYDIFQAGSFPSFQVVIIRLRLAYLSSDGFMVVLEVPKEFWAEDGPFHMYPGGVIAGATVVVAVAFMYPSHSENIANFV